MCYDLKLDGKSCRDMEKEAVFHIPRECPEWTNDNPSDPGITLLQLLSRLAGEQQRQISRTEEDIQRKYLGLMGMEPRHIRPAVTGVGVEAGPGQGEDPFPILKGTRFFAGDMAFEAVEKGWVSPARLLGASVRRQGLADSYYHCSTGFGKKMKLHPFGERPETGVQCCFLLDHGLSPVHKTDLYFEIRTDYGVRRNPADEQFLPLADVKWECYCKGGWKELLLEYDHTFAFLQSGGLRFRIPEEMVKEERLQAYLLRATVVEQEFDIAPLIENIYLNEIGVRQQHSLCDYEECSLDFSRDGKHVTLCSGLYLAQSGRTELYLETEEGWHSLKETKREQTPQGEVKLWFRKPKWAKGVHRCMLAAFPEDMEEKRIIGQGTALANQRFELHWTDIVYDDFEILVKDKISGCFMAYHKVGDFDSSSPEDAVYILDVESGRLLFGDCSRGMAPEGEIRILRMRTSRGEDGNINAGRILRCQAYPNLAVTQCRAAQGGRGEESLSHCFQRFCQELKQVNRGVSCFDYEELVKKAPGLLIAGCRVLRPQEWEAMEGRPPENQVSIVVRPLGLRGEHPRLSGRYRKNLTRILEKRKMLGARIQLLDPEYIALSIYAEIVIRPQFPQAESQMRQAVREYLDLEGWAFGNTVQYGVLYGILDTLPCVRQVKALSVSGRGMGCRHLANGDVALPPNGLVYISDLDFCINTAD